MGDTVPVLIAESGNVDFDVFAVGQRVWHPGAHGFEPVPGNSRLAIEPAHDIINSLAPRALPDVGADLMDEVPGLRPREMWDVSTFRRVWPKWLGVVVAINHVMRTVFIISRDDEGFALLARRF